MWGPSLRWARSLFGEWDLGDWEQTEAQEAVLIGCVQCHVVGRRVGLSAVAGKVALDRLNEVTEDGTVTSAAGPKGCVENDPYPRRGSLGDGVHEVIPRRLFVARSPGCVAIDPTCPDLPGDGIGECRVVRVERRFHIGGITSNRLLATRPRERTRSWIEEIDLRGGVDRQYSSQLSYCVSLFRRGGEVSRPKTAVLASRSGL